MFTKNRPHGLMCPPIFFDVRHPINPQMARTLKKGEQVDKVRAFEQWMNLVFLIRTLGARLSYLPPHENFPDMTFTANAGFFHGGKMILSSFKHAERRGESSEVQSFFVSKLGIKVVMFPSPRGNAPVFFEGQGDALWYENTLVFGYGFRSNRKSVDAVCELVKPSRRLFLKLELEHFYHLDTCFCPMEKDILWYPPAFSSASRAAIENIIVKTGRSIVVSEEDAMRFACNGIYFSHEGRRVLITSPLSPRLKQKLERLGIEVWENDVSEFLKSGGGNKCLFFLIS